MTSETSSSDRVPSVSSDSISQSSSSSQDNRSPVVGKKSAAAAVAEENDNIATTKVSPYQKKESEKWTAEELERMEQEAYGKYSNEGLEKERKYSSDELNKDTVLMVNRTPELGNNVRDSDSDEDHGNVPAGRLSTRKKKVRRNADIVNNDGDDAKKNVASRKRRKRKAKEVHLEMPTYVETHMKTFGKPPFSVTNYKRGHRNAYEIIKRTFP